MGNDGGSEERLLTKGEVAQLCRVEIRTVDRWVAAAKIKCYRTPSGRLLFQKRDVLLAFDGSQERLVQAGRSSDAPSRKASSSDPARSVRADER
jgi:predicted site-specific integrase-resolvase